MLREVLEKATISVESKGLRLDAALAKCLPNYSRSQLTQWLKSGYILVNGKQLLPKEKVEGGEQVEVKATIDVISDQAEDIALDIAYEDEHLFVVNKPAGLVMYPAAGHHEGTLLNAILHHAKECEALPRAGIIHRIDKGTTGLCVVAKTIEARNVLVERLEKREIKREYLALAKGEFVAGGTIDAPIDRHPKIRTKMAVVKKGGKPARTHYRIKERFCHFTLLDVTLDTGRTHQIRVHLSSKGHPLLGDSAYGWRCQIPGEFSESLAQLLKDFPRPALHACKLSFIHPVTQKEIVVEAPIPEDMQEVLRKLPRV